LVDEDRSVPAEASGRIPDGWSGGPGQSTLQGVLRPNHEGWYTPVTAKFSNAPTVQEIAFAPASEWAQMDTPGKRAAYAWLVQGDKLAVGEDIRMAYYDNDNITWGDRLTKLSELPYPGDNTTCSEPAGMQTAQLDFTKADYCAVNQELQLEFGWVDDVTNYLGSNVQEPFQDIQGKTKVDVQQLVSEIETSLAPPNDSLTVLTDVLEIASSVIGAFNVDDLDLELQVGLNASSAALAIAGQYTSDSSGDPVAAAAQVKARELETTISADLDTLANLERLRDIVVADFAKLSQVAKYADTLWKWNTDVHDAAVARLNVSTQRTADQALLGTVGMVFQIYPFDAWRRNNNSMANAIRYQCPDAPFLPFNDRGSGVIRPAPLSSQARLQLNPEAYPDNRQAVTASPPWSILVYRFFDGQYYEGSAPSPTLTDPLSKPPAPGGSYTPFDPTAPQKTPNAGLGFYPPWLYGRAFDPVHFDCGKF
jgi:hypothetical protein